LFYKVTYKRGKKDGLMEYYSPNGKVVFRGTFKRGKENGLLHYYTRDGVFQKTESWKNGIKQFEYYTNDEVFE
jgi:antitoxin component YwqK of YwqJK toxin-antitoxin module